MGQGSLYTGLSGLKAHSAAIDVIGNNLANVNTVGFKSARASFADVFNASQASVRGSGSVSQVGMGVQMTLAQQLFSQGSLQQTSSQTDMAIQGKGFFLLRGGDDRAVFSRAGNFSFDAEGYLVNPGGMKVQGYTERNAAGDIEASGEPRDIQIPVGLKAPPEATSYFRPHLNLNANAEVDDPATASVDEAETFSTSISVYDSLGKDHDVTLVFTPIDDTGNGNVDRWTWEARVPRSDVDVPTAPGDPEYYVLDSGDITFDGDGNLTGPAGNVPLSIPAWSNGASAQTVEWQVAGPSGDTVITGYSAPSALDSLSQDGFSVGRLDTLAVSENGVIEGVFTNGQTLALAQVALATFNNPEGLFRRGDNTYIASNGAGPAAIGGAQTGGRGSLVSGSLELSNVDITEQFTDLIVVERGYQSNSRMITTADDVLQETLSIKR
jgi:flagellar hook protein FlgE